MQSNRLIRYSITFDVVTPESAENGDFAETGFVVEGRTLLWAAGETPVDAAVALIADRLGHVEASSSGPLAASDWFTQMGAEIDYASGSERRESVHFVGLTDAEMEEVGARLAAIGLLPGCHARRA